jgi:hypothetical protein
MVIGDVKFDTEPAGVQPCLLMLCYAPPPLCYTQISFSTQDKHGHVSVVMLVQNVFSRH